MKPRKAYTPIRIDFTPFVSVALLLIVFFVWVKVAQKPNAMALSVPDRIPAKQDYDAVESDRWSIRLMLYLIGENRILYTIDNEKIVEVSIAVDGKKGLNNILASVLRKYNNRLAVIVKPTSESTFLDLVNTLDELRIAKVKRYALLDDLSPSELLAVKKIVVLSLPLRSE